jgi:hypothetical protein
LDNHKEIEMRRKRIWLVLFFILSFLAGYDFFSLVEADEVAGFRGIKWGDPLPKEGMKLIEKKQYSGKVLSSYQRKSEELKIGSATLGSITYFFWDGRFYSIIITCSGDNNNTALLNAFKERLGYPSKSDDDFYAWFGDSTNAYLRYRYTMNLKFDFFMKTEAKLVSESISKEMFAWEREQSTKGKSDF